MGMPERLKRARLEAGLSQRKLAQLVKGTEASIIRYESGQARPRPARLKAIAEITNKPVSYFLEDDFTVPTTAEKFHSPEAPAAYRIEADQPAVISEGEISYLLRLEQRLIKIETELSRLSAKISTLLKESPKKRLKKPKKSP